MRPRTSRKKQPFFSFTSQLAAVVNCSVFSGRISILKGKLSGFPVIRAAMLLGFPPGFVSPENCFLSSSGGNCNPVRAHRFSACQAPFVLSSFFADVRASRRLAFIPSGIWWPCNCTALAILLPRFRHCFAIDPRRPRKFICDLWESFRHPRRPLGGLRWRVGWRGKKERFLSAFNHLEPL